MKLLGWLVWPIVWLGLSGTERTRMLVCCGDDVLLVHGRLEWLTGDHRWSLPGGGLHHHENALAGACRETREELSIVVNPKQLKPLGKMQIAEHGITYLAHFYKVNMPEKVTPRVQKLEIAEARWFGPAELAKLPLTTEVRQGLELLAGQ
jgi:8-oxo-dGTP pyrophosphatase MutT (NUDIX family)